MICHTARPNGEGGPDLSIHETNLKQHCVNFFPDAEVVFWEEFTRRSCNSNVGSVNASDHSRKTKFACKIICCFFLSMSIWPTDEVLQLLDNNAQQIIDTAMITQPCHTKSVTQQAVLPLMCYKVQQHQNLILQVHSTASTPYKNHTLYYVFMYNAWIAYAMNSQPYLLIPSRSWKKGPISCMNFWAVDGVIWKNSNHCAQL